MRYRWINLVQAKTTIIIKGRRHRVSLETKHVIDAATQDILDETLNAPRKEKPAGHVVVLIIFLRNAEARSVNVEAIRSQKRNLILRGTRIVTPSKLRSWVLTLAHEGHPGIVSMRLRLLILLLQRMLSTQDQTIRPWDGLWKSKDCCTYKTCSS